MIDRFTDTFLDEVRAAASITEVVGKHVQWDKGRATGDVRWACCPLHGESTPSLKADDREGFWKCHGCGEGGDQFKFLMLHLGIDFPAAVAEVAGMAGIALPDGMGGGKPARPPEQPRQTKERPQPSAAEIRPEIVKTYDYTDPDGTLLYQVVRMQRKMADGSWARTKDGKGTWKTFLQRRPDGAGKWIWSLAAGEFMRRPGGDWRVFDREKFADGMETRFFDAGAEHTIYRHPAVEIAIADGQPILIVEGEKDADTAVALGFCGTTNSSGSKHWTEHHAACFRDADVVICLDNDAAGDRADKLAKSMKGIARRIRVLNFADHVPGFDHKGDITDWVEKFGGDAAQLSEIIGRLPDWRPPPPMSKFGAIGLDRLHEPHLKHDFLIDGFLDRRGVAMMPGASGSGKTFLVLEIGMCVALNQSFWGMKVKPGLVIYQAGEGKEGVTKRLDGWLQDRGVEGSSTVPFQMLPKKVNLFVDDKDTDDLIAESQAWAEYYGQPVRLVVVDTFNKAITGANENAGQDMGKVLSRLERISETLDCAVLVPMHKSKQGDMRGHTSLMGDASNVINVSKLEIRDGNGRQIRTAALDKNKDGEGGHPMRFVLRQVVTGVEDDGRPRTTCVVDRPNGDDEQLVAEGKLSLNQTLFLQALRDAIDIEGEEAPDAVKGVPKGKHVVKYRAFEARLWNKWPFTAPEHEIEKRKKEFERAVGDAGKRLVTYGYVERDNETKLIWWTGKSMSPKPSRPPRQFGEEKLPSPPGLGVSDSVLREIQDSGVPF